MTPELTLADGELNGQEAFRAWLREQVDEAGSVVAIARRFKAKEQFVSQLLSGRASIGPGTARRFGFDLQRFTVYIPIPPESMEG